VPLTDDKDIVLSRFNANVRDRDGKEQSISAQDGHTLMEAIRDSGFGDVLAICGGCCSCATCHVYVDDRDLDRLPAMSADEETLLQSLSSREKGSRLSCQIPVTAALDGIRIEVAPEE
jgi:ferredoxin, 2Fe-2S